MILRVGTRQSALARTQTAGVIAQLLHRDPSLEVETVLITTSGDRAAVQATSELPLKGLFTKELDEALLAHRIDVAIHSFKDIPPGPMRDLALVAVPEREDARDAWISARATPFFAEAPGARVATNSVRRRALLIQARPDLRVFPLRGNVDTRLRKLREGAFDGLVLACAGLKRLGLEDQITEPLSLDTFLPAAGQGALGLVVRAADADHADAAFSALRQLDHAPSRLAVLCEQSCLNVLAGSCHTPIAVHAAWTAGRCTVRAKVLHPEGVEHYAAEISDLPATFNPTLVGRQLAEQLLTQGAQRLLAL